MRPWNMEKGGQCPDSGAGVLASGPLEWPRCLQKPALMLFLRAPWPGGKVALLVETKVNFHNPMVTLKPQKKGAEPPSPILLPHPSRRCPALPGSRIHRI